LGEKEEPCQQGYERAKKEVIKPVLTEKNGEDYAKK
jgi:hypothetical protein